MNFDVIVIGSGPGGYVASQHLLKKENRSLKNDQIAYKTKNEQLKEDNKVLLREIDRLKSLTEPQN